MEIHQPVAKNVQRIRRERGMSQEDVAHLADVHQTYLSGVEGAKLNPSIGVLERIAKALKIDISEFFKTD